MERLPNPITLATDAVKFVGKQLLGGGFAELADVVQNAKENPVTTAPNQE